MQLRSRSPSLAALALVSGLIAGACAGGSSGPTSSGNAGTTGSGGGGTGIGGGSGGAAGNGSAGAGAGTTGTAGSVSGGTTGGGTTGTAGASAGNSGSAGSSGGSTGGQIAGAGGTTTGGSGGSGIGGRGGGAVAGTSGGGSSGRGGSAGGSAGAGGATAPSCPTNATFCSGFEDATMPAGSVYKVNAAPGEWTRDFAIDATVRRSGNSSLRVKSASESATSGSAYKMLAVPATAGAFWVRFFVRSDVDMGGEHNAFAIASDSDDPNASANVEFAEDVGISFNASDDVRWPTGYGRLTTGGTNPYVLAKTTWHCVEISFDGTNRVQQLYVNGSQLINATSYPSAPRAFRVFKFGFVSFHGPPRQMWYDDVAVAPTRVGGCP